MKVARLRFKYDNVRVNLGHRRSANNRKEHVMDFLFRRL